MTPLSHGPRRRPGHRARRAALASLLAIGAAWPAQAIEPSVRPPLSEAARRGAALYDAAAPLRARLLGHERDLPPAAIRCANCHDPRAARPATPLRASAGPDAGQRGADGNLGPPLDAGALTSLRARRGGPPSRYDARSLCTLLRTGVDPAQIVIPSAMPRYALSDGDCRDLWAYLYERSGD